VSGVRSATRFARRIPRAGRACFLIAFVNVVVWTVVVPPFQVPDEISHFGYAQYVAEQGKPPPQGPGAQYSPQEQGAMNLLDFSQVVGHDQQRGILLGIEEEGLREALAVHASPVGEGGVSSITNQPPLYYALEAIPYWVSPSHEILTRLEIMRLLSALMAALTVLCIFMFLREIMPGSPWTWTVGSLAVAFQPTFCFIGAGVQGDNLLYLASAAVFLALARAYRRGLDVTRGGVIGLITVVGVLGKLTFLALVPGVALAVLLLLRRASPQHRATALRGAALAAAIVVVPVLAYGVLNAGPWHRGGVTGGGLAGATTAGTAVGTAINLRQTLDYVWQLVLPRLPFMHREFAYFPLTTTWLDGIVGHFGWLDYVFPAWVYTAARWVFVALAALAAISVVRLRAAIRPWLGLIFCFVVMMVGLMGAIGDAGIHYRATTGLVFEQARYLFPGLALYALLIVLAARGVGRRWAPALGAALVLLAMVHGLFAETLTISRYYG
jgi:hypothetical protein